VRPSRNDIAAPEFPGRIDWLNLAQPPRMAALVAAGPVLVHFFDFAQLNSVRALPYVLEWNRRYAPLGLTVAGIHSPRFRFSGEPEVATAGVEELGVEHPVALDSGYAIWHDYGCKGWPSLFLWGRGGALAWAHFGEGEYRATEEAIQEELRGDDLTVELPSPLEPLRPTDAPGALVAPPSEELFPGGSPADPWVPEAGDGRIEVEYEAGAAYVVADGGGELRAGVDGAEPIPLAGTGLIPLAEHPRHERHRVTLEAGGDVRIWAISFAPGMP
jgi:hypothetical protein